MENSSYEVTQDSTLSYAEDGEYAGYDDEQQLFTSGRDDQETYDEGAASADAAAAAADYSEDERRDDRALFLSHCRVPKTARTPAPDSRAKEKHDDDTRGALSSGRRRVSSVPVHACGPRPPLKQKGTRYCA